LEREDLLGQALSWMRARQTKQYRSTSPRKRDAVYDHAMAASCLKTIVMEQARRRRFFAQAGIAPLHLTLEQVVADPRPASTMWPCCWGLPPCPVDEAQVDLQVQRDEQTEFWRRRLLADEAALAPSLHAIT
jgi:LPS sulfotransferase NodH